MKIFEFLDPTPCYYYGSTVANLRVLSSTKKEYLADLRRQAKRQRPTKVSEIGELEKKLGIEGIGLRQ